MYKPAEIKSIKKKLLKGIREGSSIEQLHSKNNIPSKNVIYKLLNKDAQFRDDYTRAREQQALFYAEKIGGVITALKTDSAPSREKTDIARLEVDALKWIASKLLPKVYGSLNNQTNVQVNIQPVTGMSILDSTEEMPPLEE